MRLFGLLLFMAMCVDVSAEEVTDSVVTLQQVLIEAKARPVCMRGDTLVYAVPAFTTHEGERLRALLKDVPGIEVLADGTIKARGRVVDRLLLNGHELLGLGVGAVLDNLPAGYLQNILLYDDACRHEKETGVYEGATEQVMDLITTEENRSAWLTDISAGAGTEGRYSANASAGRYSDLWQHMFTATVDNLPNNFGVGESFYDKLQRTSGTADIAHHNVNACVSWEKGQWRVQGSAFYDGSHKRDNTESLLEAFLQGHTSRTECSRNSGADTRTANFQMSLTWQDTLWTVHLDPIISWNKTSTDLMTLNSTLTDNQRVNEKESTSHSADDILAAGLRFSFNRKFGARGRNIDLRGNLNLQRESMHEHDRNELHFLQPVLMAQTIRHADSHDDMSGAVVTLAYIEPFTSFLKLKAEYSLGINRSVAEHPVQLFSADTWGFSDSLSRSAQSRNLQQHARVSLQYKRKKLRVHVGLLVEGNRTHTVSNRFFWNVDVTRNVVDWSPEMTLHYVTNHGLTLTASYGGRTRQPSIFDLLEGDDISDPLNVRRGNPGLRPSFVHQVRASLSHFAPVSQRQINFAAGLDWEQYAITDRVFFDAVRGMRLYQPTNVNGNRSVMASWGLQTPLDSGNRLWLDCQGDYNLSRIVGYQMVDYGHTFADDDEIRYSTVQSRLMQYLGIQYNVGFLQLKPYGYLRYDHIGSDLVGAITQDIFLYGYGALLRLEHPKGFSASIDAYEHERRGFIDTHCNTNSIIIDIELAYAFLKNRAAEVRLMAYDVLRQRDVVEGVATQVGRRESRGSSVVNSYYMATLTYRF